MALAWPMLPLAWRLLPSMSGAPMNEQTWKRLKRLPAVHTMLAYFRTVSVAANGSGDLGWFSYEGWRDRFLQMRLHLTFGLGAMTFSSFAFLDLVRGFLPDRGLSLVSVAAKIAIAALLLLLRHRLRPKRTEPHLLPYFLGVVAIVQVLPESLDLLFLSDPSMQLLSGTGLYQWTILFFVQATLIPVCWRWHALSQLLVVVHAFGGRELVGDAIRSTPQESRGELVLALFWVCLACNLSVYLYERLQRAEFSARCALANTCQELEIAEERYRSIFENAIEGIFQASMDGRYLSANPALARMYGYHSPTDAIAAIQHIGRDLFVDTSEYDRLLAILERDGQAVDFEVLARRVDGTTIWVTENLRALHNGTGRLVGYEGTVIDISARKEAEEKIQASLAVEKQLNRLKTDFVAMTSHEFRTPLTTILAAAESLDYYGERWLRDKRSAYLRRIQGAALHMGELLESVLTIGHADSGRLPFRPVPLAVEPWCCALLEELGPLVGDDREILFEVSGVPPAGQPICLDEQLLRHVLVNLLSNALKYSPPNCNVTFGVTYGDGTITFWVRDRGIGIPEADLPRLFDSFHRASNVGQRQGTGLGMAIVKRSLELHGGTISVSTQEGKGTTFEVQFPVFYGVDGTGLRDAATAANDRSGEG